MIALKLFFGLMLGVGIYGFMAYYQPITESYAATAKVEAQALRESYSTYFISSVPQEQLVYNSQ